MALSPILQARKRSLRTTSSIGAGNSLIWHRAVLPMRHEGAIAMDIAAEPRRRFVTCRREIARRTYWRAFEDMIL
jgi:hypothetical protein